MKWKNVKDIFCTTILFAILPYAFELIAEALVSPAFLPEYYGDKNPEGRPPAMAMFLSASVWAGLSPAIVIPNMLKFVEEGLSAAGRVVLTGAPFEVSTALVTQGVMNGVLSAENEGSPVHNVLAHLPVFIIGSVLYGVAFGLGFYIYFHLRKTERFTKMAGIAEPTETIFVFLVIYLLCYSTSIGKPSAMSLF